MTEYIVIAIFITWYIFALIVSETVGKKTKMGVQWLFFFSVMFTPIVGYLIAKVSPKVAK